MPPPATQPSTPASHAVASLQQGGTKSGKLDANRPAAATTRPRVATPILKRMSLLRPRGASSDRLDSGPLTEEVVETIWTRWVDRVYFVRSIFFSLILIVSWNVIIKVFKEGVDIVFSASDQGEANAASNLGKLGFALCTVLFTLQAVSILSYTLDIRQLVRARRRAVEGSGADETGLIGCLNATFGSRVSRHRMRRRLRYLCERYQPRALYWQVVVWARQFCLFVDALVPDLAISEDGLALASSTVFSPERDRALSALWWHSGTAMTILFVFLLWHLRVMPYCYSFQNSVETFLLLTDIVAIGLGMLYTYFKLPSAMASTGNGTDFNSTEFCLNVTAGSDTTCATATLSSIEETVVEALLMCSLVGSLLIAAAVLGYGWWAGSLVERQANDEWDMQLAKLGRTLPEPCELAELPVSADPAAAERACGQLTLLAAEAAHGSESWALATARCFSLHERQPSLAKPAWWNDAELLEISERVLGACPTATPTLHMRARVLSASFGNAPWQRVGRASLDEGETRSCEDIAHASRLWRRAARNTSLAPDRQLFVSRALAAEWLALQCNDWRGGVLAPDRVMALVQIGVRCRGVEQSAEKRSKLQSLVRTNLGLGGSKRDLWARGASPFEAAVPSAGAAAAAGATPLRRGSLTSPFSRVRAQASLTDAPRPPLPASDGAAPGAGPPRPFASPFKSTRDRVKAWFGARDRGLSRANRVYLGAAPAGAPAASSLPLQGDGALATVAQGSVLAEQI